MNSELKLDIINSLKLHDADSGSVLYQITSLTFQINDLMDHFKLHNHDYSGKRGLLKKVTRRRKYLDYLKAHDHEFYLKLIEKLNLRK